MRRAPRWVLGPIAAAAALILADGAAAQTQSMLNKNATYEFARAAHDLQQAVDVQISMADIGAAWQNGYAERLIRTIKDEEVDLSQYEDYHDAMTQLGQFLDDVYMHKRIHSLLGYLTPVEFEAQWRALQASASSIP